MRRSCSAFSLAPLLRALPLSLELVPFTLERGQTMWTIAVRSGQISMKGDVPSRLLSGREFLREVGCLQGLRSGDALRGIVLKQLLSEIQSSGSHPSDTTISITLNRYRQRYSLLEQIPEMVGNGILRLHELIPRQVRHVRPPVCCRRTDDLVNDVQLMDLIVALEDRLLCEKLQHDASAMR